MAENLLNPELWKAFALFLWPIVILICFFLARGFLTSFLSKDEVNIEIGGQKISLKNAAKSIGNDVTDIQSRLAALEEKIPNKNKNDFIEKSKSDEKSTNERIKSLLWVDDYPSNNGFLIEKFKSQGINVVISLTTLDGLEKLKTQSFDAVISDLGREEGGVNNDFAGLDLLNKMYIEKLNIPTLIFAGHRGLAFKQELINAGAYDVTSSGVDVIKFVENFLK